MYYYYEYEERVNEVVTKRGMTEDFVPPKGAFSGVWFSGGINARAALDGSGSSWSSLAAPEGFQNFFYAEVEMGTGGNQLDFNLLPGSCPVAVDVDGELNGPVGERRTPTRTISTSHGTWHRFNYDEPLTSIRVRCTTDKTPLKISDLNVTGNGMWS
ncbi:hypothetical protein ACIQMR_36895 [Streptomyces sp. NPDC091376]|uniref:hypothetical protein n=1 Tax=Streptomyces sp. NPDC091376 TaxID=3365994 RepID=UPI0038005E05